MVHFDTSARATNISLKIPKKKQTNLGVSKKKGALHFTNQCLPTKMFSKNLSTIYGWKPLVKIATTTTKTPYRTPWCCKGRSSNDRPSASMIPQISPEASESDPEDSLIDSVVSPRTRATKTGMYGWMWMCRSAFGGENYTPQYISVGSHEFWSRNQKIASPTKSRSTTWMDVFVFWH